MGTKAYASKDLTAAVSVDSSCPVLARFRGSESALGQGS